MDTNHQMNYYDYGKTLDAQGVMPVIMGGVSHDTNEYIDLGLSVKWATCNIGANSPEEAGMYFAWGEISGFTAEQIGNEEGKRAFGWQDYEFGFPYALTKYNGKDGLTVLEPEDDAATENWGEEWKMPTKEQFNELISSANTTTAFTEQNGVSGLLVTSKVEGHEGNSVFFPAVGKANNEGVVGITFGRYWSASLDSKELTYAWSLEYVDGYCAIGSMNTRESGLSVRPIHK